MTATTAAARDHARAQAGARAAAMPTIPATDATDLPAGVAAASVVWDETVPGGGFAQAVLALGTTVRLVDLEGEGAAHIALYNALNTAERLCVADTVKVMWQAYLTTGHPLLSDQGRVLATLLADTSVHHDALCGTSTLAGNEARYGSGAAHGPSPAGRELLVAAAARHGMGRRDLPPSLCLLKGARVAGDGGVSFAGGAGPGAAVELRCEMPLVVLIANVPHPLDQRSQYVSTPLRITAWRSAPTSAADPWRQAGPEAERAYLATEHHLRARGLR